LSPGIGLLFTIDIIFDLIALSLGLPLWTALFVFFQCIIIILFYVLIWQVEPFTSRFADHVTRMKNQLSRDMFPPWLVSGLFMGGILMAVLLFLTTIILLPGVTVNTFISQSGLSELGHLVTLLVVLSVSQYFAVRYIHGIASKAMGIRLLDNRERALQNLLELEYQPESRSVSQDDPRLDAMTLLLESRIYRIQRNTFAGTFPVFVVNPDFSVILDTTTLTVIRGYIEEKYF
jgi:hypothetical protein